MRQREFAGNFEDCGFVLVPDAALYSQLEILKAFFANADMARAARGGETYGARNLLSFPAVREATRLPALQSLFHILLGPNFRAVRGLFFDKTEGANWPVLWHQDLSLAVKQRHDLPGLEQLVGQAWRATCAAACPCVGAHGHSSAAS